MHPEIGGRVRPGCLSRRGSLTMWTTLAFAAALTLAPAQAGQLELTNARTTYGLLGAPRTDGKYLPGDSFTLSFDIEGMTVDDSGKVLYSIALEVADSS